MKLSNQLLIPHWSTIAVIGILLFFAFGCTADKHGKEACLIWVEAFDDMGEGLLSDDEFRDRIKEVRRAGRFAETKEIADATERLVEVTIPVAQDGASEAMLALLFACEDIIGYKMVPKTAPEPSG